MCIILWHILKALMKNSINLKRWNTKKKICVFKASSKQFKLSLILYTKDYMSLMAVGMG